MNRCVNKTPFAPIFVSCKIPRCDLLFTIFSFFFKYVSCQPPDLVAQYNLSKYAVYSSYTHL